MSVAVRSSTLTHTSGSSISATVPAGAQINDIMIAFIASDGSSGTLTAPDTTWAQLDYVAISAPDGEHAAVFWKRLTAADTGTYTFGSSASLDVTVDLVCLSGASTAGPPTISVSTTSTTANNSPVTVPANALAAASADVLLYLSVLDDTTSSAWTWANPSGFTELQADTTANWTPTYVGAQSGAATASGTISAVATGSGLQAGYISWTVLVPAVVTGATVRSWSVGTDGYPSLSVTVPANASINDIMVAVLTSNSGSGAISPPDASWVQLDQETQATPSPGEVSAVFWKRLTAADTGSYVFTQTTNAGISGTITDIAGADTTNPPVISTDNIDTSATAIPFTATANGITAVAGDALLYLLALAPGNNQNAYTWTTPTGFTDAGMVTASVHDVVYSATKVNAAAGATGPVSATVATGGTTSGYQAWLVRVPAASSSPAYSASGALSGSGSLTATAAPQIATSAALAGSGTLTAGSTLAAAGTAALSGTGTLTASTTLAASASAAMSGVGVLSAATTLATATTVALAGTGTLTATAVPGGGNTYAGPAVLAGTGTLTAGATVTTAAAAALSGSGTVTVSGAPAFAATVAFTGTGVLTAANAAQSSGSATFISTGTLATGNAPATFTAGSFTSVGTLAVVSTLTVSGTAALSGTGTLVALVDYTSVAGPYLAALTGRQYVATLNGRQYLAVIQGRPFTAVTVPRQYTAVTLPRQYEGALT